MVGAAAVKGRRTRTARPPIAPRTDPPPPCLPVPPLRDLGTDLLGTSRAQRVRTLTRPLWLLSAYAGIVWWGASWPLPVVMFLLFISIVTATHDVVHGALGLGRLATDVSLFLLGAVLLQSGHAYRRTHLRHHRVFPRGEDPEGAPAHGSAWRAILTAPSFLPRLWSWAFRRAPARSAERAWLCAELAWMLGVVAAAVWLWPTSRALGIYVALAVAGSWSYPLLTVHLPHRPAGPSPWHQTHTLRGRLLPRLFLELTYHLEHHLYPRVPSHNLAALSRRLQPVMDAAGVVPTRVP